MKQTRVEVYDDNGLIQVYYIESEEEELTPEEILSQKEKQLLEIYDEIKLLRSNLTGE
jgi:hypothetical protein